MNFNDDVFNKFPMLETSRLVLRKIHSDDKNEIFSVYSNHEAMKYFGRHPMKLISEAEERINKTKSAFKNKEGIRWGITSKPDNKLIGSAGIWRIVREHLRGEIGYELHPSHWRKGIMVEALSAIIKFSFEKMNLHSIEANIDPLNTASEKLLMKLGFEKEGYFKESFFFEDEFHDTAIYSLIRKLK